jgi:hypothetical protein
VTTADATVVLFEVRRVQHAPGAAEAKRRWERGLAVPARITLALDMLKLDGPEVDEACGVQEPTVDRWEQGLIYPTWEQLCRLAVLTGFAVAFFTAPAEDLNFDHGPHFRPGYGNREPSRPAPLVPRFTDKAINRTLGARRICPTCGHRGATSRADS